MSADSKMIRGPLPTIRRIRGLANRSRIRCSQVRASAIHTIHARFEPLGHVITLGLPMVLSVVVFYGSGGSAATALTGVALEAVALVLWLSSVALPMRYDVPRETIRSIHLAAALLAGIGAVGVVLDGVIHVLAADGSIASLGRVMAVISIGFALRLSFALRYDVIGPYLANPAPSVLMVAPAGGLVECRRRLAEAGAIVSATGIWLSIGFHITGSVPVGYQRGSWFVLVQVLGIIVMLAAQRWAAMGFRPNATIWRLAAFGAVGAMAGLMIGILHEVARGTADGTDIALFGVLGLVVPPLVLVFVAPALRGKRLGTGPGGYRQLGSAAAMIALLLSIRSAQLAAARSPYLLAMTAMATGVGMFAFGLRGRLLGQAKAQTMPIGTPAVDPG